MNIFLALTSISNIGLCFWQIKISHKNKELTIISWLLMFYFSILLSIEIIENKIHKEGYSGFIVSYLPEDYLNVVLFVFCCNIMLAIGYSISRYLFKREKRSQPYQLEKTDATTKLLTNIYSIIFITALPIYFINSLGMSYTDFVTYKESNWGLVLLYVSASLISILFIQKKYNSSLFITLFFIYFAISSTVRSFYIFSIFPCVIIFYLNKNISGSSLSRLIFNKISIILISLLAVTFTIIGDQRELTEVLPEQSLVKYLILIIYKISNGYSQTGFDSIQHFTYGAISPFAKFFGIEKPESLDVQEYFASLAFGYKTAIVFMHYPSLWYADAYSSFGWIGITFGIYWGLFLYTIEHMLRKNLISFSIFIPIFTWVVYLIMRGAIGISLQAISYPFYINLLIYYYVTIYKGHKSREISPK
jgi:hypothetical protein